MIGDNRYCEASALLRVPLFAEIQCCMQTYRIDRYYMLLNNLFSRLHPESSGQPAELERKTVALNQS
jgi:hypothetical protein